jgi:transcriptional regulator
LEQVGFELIDDQRSVLVEQIRTAVLDYVGDRALMEKWKLSAYLSDRLAKSYTLLSSAFSAARGMTIERFFILQKVERAKELLIYDELTMSEIAFRLNYSSPAHLSGQFKQVTGLSPSEFKRLGGTRHSLDQL